MATTREQWLTNCATDIAEKILGPAGLDRNAETGEPIVDGFRITCGWPSSRGTSRSKRVLGQCFSTRVSKDGTAEIFISPYLDDAVTIASATLHEMLHAAVGVDEKHGPAFKRACQRVGLEGKPSETVASAKLAVTLSEIVAGLGEYPHKQLDVTNAPKQTTRLLKAVCMNDECPGKERGRYTVRMSGMWAREGAPYCGICGDRMHVDLPEHEEKEEAEGETPPPPTEEEEAEEPDTGDDSAEDGDGDCEEDGDGEPEDSTGDDNEDPDEKRFEESKQWTPEEDEDEEEFSEEETDDEEEFTDYGEHGEPVDEETKEKIRQRLRETRDTREVQSLYKQYGIDNVDDLLDEVADELEEDEEDELQAVEEFEKNDIPAPHPIDLDCDRGEDGGPCPVCRTELVRMGMLTV